LSDRVLFAGTSASGNDGGISYIDHNGTTTSAEQVLVSTATLTDFLDRPAPATADIRSMTTDDDGNVFFNDIGTSTLIRLDPQGRLVKVTTRNERDLVFTGAVGASPTPNSNNLRLQTYQHTHPSAGAITRVVYVESTPLNFVAAVDVFDPSDFNREGSTDAADVALFKPKLGTRGSVAALSDARYDLNGNGSIDWKDVKILQSFVPSIRNGDANMDGAVDFIDLNILRDNYLGTGKTWLEGDFASLVANSAVYLPTASDANVVNYVDLETLAGTWLNVLGQPAPTEQDLDANGYTGQFRNDVIAAFNIPEPMSLGLLPLAGLLLGRRRAP
ncbi:MAG TPA: dockerin type I domain-containing protein, partial [Tepidisphaeraceae bacterium]|nr:dockerin type I domain-containing protein [Tepidisphaeraceae bacterium]